MTVLNLHGANILTQLPGVALDGHAHVFETRLGLAPTRRYTPDQDALLSTYADHLMAYGLNGALLVQPSFLGNDNTYLLAALQAGNAQVFSTKDGENRRLAFRGVVTLNPDTPYRVLADMDRAGVVGMRLNLFGKPAAEQFDVTIWRNVLKRVSDLGWHIDVHCIGSDLALLLPQLLDHAERVTVDHFGLPDPEAPLACAGQAAILTAPRGRVFVKASGPYRVFRNQNSVTAARMCAPIFARLLRELGPEQLMWGSDWPSTQFESRHTFADTLHWLHDWSVPNFDRRPYRAPEFAGQADAPRGRTEFTVS